MTTMRWFPVLWVALGCGAIEDSSRQAQGSVGQAGGGSTAPAGFAGAGGGGAFGNSAPAAQGTPIPAAGPPADSGPLKPRDECAAISEVTEPVQVEQDVTAADVIWIVDSSCSMFDEAQRVQDNLNGFSQFVEASSIDIRLVMITAAGFVQVPPPLGVDPSRFLFVQEDVGSEEGLSDLLGAFPQYQSFLRDQAPTHIVAVTDDESQLPASAFQDQMRSLLGHDFTLHAIASEDTGSGSACNNLWGAPCPGAATPGCQYVELAQQTGGEFVSICTPAGSWPDIFQNLGTAVLESTPVALPCDYAIPTPQDGGPLDPNKVNVRYTASGGSAEFFGRVDSAAMCADSLGWHYDDPGNPRRLSLCPAACDTVSQGGEMSIVFGCETVLILVE